MSEDQREDRAFGRDGYVLEGIQDAARGIGKVLAYVILTLMAVGTLVIASHVVPAWLARDNPPLACQLAGGTWSPWNGWTCG